MGDPVNHVHAVQERLDQRYASEPWFRGTGIRRGSKPGTLAIELLVSEGFVPAALPSVVDGVEVRTVKTGPITTSKLMQR